MKKYVTILFCIIISLLTLNTIFAQPKINEAFSRGTTVEPDWVEVYNPSASPIDVSGYMIYDNGGQAGTKPKKLFPSGTILPPNGFYAITVDNTGDASDFGLSSGGDKVWLENTSGIIIDSVEIPALPDTATSYGRLPDGSENWQILNPRTKGSSNSATDINDMIGKVSEYKLYQNYPNPFNPSTTISYRIAKPEFVILKVFNVLGREVATLVNETKNAGLYEVKFNGANLSSGVYLYQLNAGTFKEIKKFTIMK